MTRCTFYTSFFDLPQQCSDVGEYCRDELVLEAVGEAVRHASRRGMQGWEVRLFLRLFCTIMESMCAKGEEVYSRYILTLIFMYNRFYNYFKKIIIILQLFLIVYNIYII